MPSTTNKPSVFISSTISDFRDLRGSLKYWLEENGFEVWLSEYNDMEKNPGANTFDACFDSIRRSDFYVLLIGERRGSQYSAVGGDEVSVTQREYAVAYDSFVAVGRPIPIYFVRSSVKDRIDGWLGAGQSGSPPFEDGSFVAGFIAEVERERETSSAVATAGPYPLANWLHRFSSFRDIIDALKISLALRADISTQRVLSALKLDLEVMLSALVGKHKHSMNASEIREMLAPRFQGNAEELGRVTEGMDVNFPFPGHWPMMLVVDNVPLRQADQSPQILTQQQRIYLTLYLVGGLAHPNSELWLGALRGATATGALLGYDPSSRTMQETELSRAVSELIEETVGYEGRYRIVQPFLGALLDDVAASNRRKDPEFYLDWFKSVPIWGLYHSQVNLYRRVASLYAHLSGAKPSPWPENLLPKSPYGPQMDERIKEERADRASVRDWGRWDGFWRF